MGFHNLGTIDHLEWTVLCGRVSTILSHSLSTRWMPVAYIPGGMSPDIPDDTSLDDIPRMDKMCCNLFPFQMFRLCTLSRWNKYLCCEFLVRHFSACPKGNTWNVGILCIFLRLMIHVEPLLSLTTPLPLPPECLVLTINSSFAFIRLRMTMYLMVAFALQKNVPELKTDERQVTCLKWWNIRKTTN